MSNQETIEQVNQQYQNIIEERSNTPQDFRINPIQIKRIIGKLKLEKAPEDNGISPRVLKNLSKH